MDVNCVVCREMFTDARCSKPQPQMIISQLQNTHRSQDLIQLCLLVIGGRIGVTCFNKCIYIYYIYIYIYIPYVHTCEICSNIASTNSTSRMCCIALCAHACVLMQTSHSPHAHLIHDVMYTCTEHASDYIDVQSAALEMVYT